MTETIVSMVPYSINESIASVPHPAVVIPPVSEGEIDLAYVEDTYCMIYLDAERGYLRRPIPSAEFADSIVRCFVAATICVDGDAQPGIFHVPGKLTKTEVKAKYKDLIEKHQKLQRAW